MKNGETLTIGRQGDIIIAANDMTVSRKHFTITRDGDSFIIKDISTNGSFMGSAKSANPTYNNKKLNKYKIDKNKPVKDHVSFYRDNKNYSKEQNLGMELVGKVLNLKINTMEHGKCTCTL